MILSLALVRASFLKEFVSGVFAEIGLNWENHVLIDSTLYRPSDLDVSRANPSKANELLRWKTSGSMPGVVKRLVAFNNHAFRYRLWTFQK